jgi:hypothetical protein
VDIHFHLPVLHSGPNHKTGTPTKPVNELHHPVFPEFSPLSRARDALQKLRRLLRRDGWPFERLRLAFQDDDRRLAEVQLQRIRSIRMKKMQEIIHRIHTFRSDITTRRDRRRKGPVAGIVGFNLSPVSGQPEAVLV